jgi:hypothetical protein
VFVSPPVDQNTRILFCSYKNYFYKINLESEAALCVAIVVADKPRKGQPPMKVQHYKRVQSKKGFYYSKKDGQNRNV